MTNILRGEESPRGSSGEEQAILLAQRETHWNLQYGETGELPPPTQFAAFMSQEINKTSSIIEFGCGSGRDSIFFAQQGFRVIGIDASASAVQLCRTHAERLHLGSAMFINASINTAFESSCITNIIHAWGNPHVVVYSRFFLHAITDEEESCFLGIASDICRNGGLLVCEFRTPRDRLLIKSTAKHYRRFVNPSAFCAKALGYSFEARYAVEGFGYAKYRNDDAYVCRLILSSDS